MSDPGRPSEAYQKATQLLSQLREAKSSDHSEASGKITKLVADELPRIKKAADAGNMVAEKGFLETLNSTLEGLERNLNTQGARNLQVASRASELIVELRNLYTRLG